MRDRVGTSDLIKQKNRISEALSSNILHNKTIAIKPLNARRSLRRAFNVNIGLLLISIYRMQTLIN